MSQIEEARRAHVHNQIRAFTKRHRWAMNGPALGIMVAGGLIGFAVITVSDANATLDFVGFACAPMAFIIAIPIQTACVRRVIRNHDSCCMYCDYDLSNDSEDSNVTRVCPECGRHVLIITLKPSWWRWRGVLEDKPGD